MLIPCFNTTLVQLKAFTSPARAWRARLFQYHTGPIKSLWEWAHSVQALCSFNTTLVQLKAYVRAIARTR